MISKLKNYLPGLVGLPSQIQFPPPNINIPPPGIEVDNEGLYLQQGQRLGDYTVKDILGIGGTAVLFSCEDKSGKKVALKRFQKDKIDQILKNKIMEESSLKIRSNCVVGSDYCFEMDGFMHSVAPFLEGGCLGDILEKSVIIGEKDAFFVAICITLAAVELEKRGILSTDIKPGNIILGDDGYAKLIDLSCFERQGNRADNSLGTMPYAAPELVKRRSLHSSTDVYSIGVLMLEMLVGSERFFKMTEGWEKQIKKGIRPDITFLRGAYPRASAIIEKAAEYEPQDRYDCAGSLLFELKNHFRSLTSSGRVCSIYSGNREIIPPEGLCVIGRDAIEHGNFYISEKHFESDFNGRGLKIRNISKSNGVAVNKKTVGQDWSEVGNGDSISIANASLKVCFQ